MSYPCQCPPKIGEPIPYKTYTCQPNTIFLNYFMSQLLLNASYYNYLQTGVNQAPNLKNQFSYIVPKYTFKYYSVVEPHNWLKTYTYEELFQFHLLSQQYKTLESVPEIIKVDWDATDKQLFNNLLILPMTEKLYQSILLANQQRANGLQYSYTFTIPANIAYTFKDDIPPNQDLSHCYPGDELITISRNARPIVNAYVFKGAFPDYNP